QDLKKSDFESLYLEKSTIQNKYEINGYVVEEKAKVFEVFKSETKEKFVIFKNISNKTITKTIVEELLKNGRTKKPLTGFKSKKIKNSVLY
uniref:topoisomerase C-terminal repeat-containing protein n=1 Tax=Enterococcus faecium TaxID=1352 RepID=UPI0034E9429A